MQGIEKELLVFVVAVLSGASVRLAYRCLGCFRDIIPHSLLLINIEDILFWIGSAVYLFIQIYQTNSGSISWHFILGAALGAILMTLFVKRCEKILGKFFER